MKLFLKALLALFCALLVWEVILSTTVIKIPGNYKHPELGKIYKKGLIISGQEGYSITHINSLGMRNKEITLKQPGEKRIITLGDSYTMALQVDDNHIFTTLLDKYLNKNIKNHDFNVINAGILGYSPANYIYLSDFYKKTINPDYVVVQINASDFCRDMIDKNTFINTIKQGNTYKLKVNKEFVSENPLKKMFSQLNDFTVFSTFRLSAEKIQEMLAMKKTNVENADKIGDYYDLADWSFKNLKSNYKNLVILYIPEIDYTDIDKKPLKVEFDIEKAAKKYNVNLINMRAPFIDYYKKTLQPVNGFNNTKPGDGHLNDAGHKLIAEKLADYFKGKFIK